MSFNGSGTFLINTAGQPVVSGTVISSTAFNALTADLATGLSTAITKDGQTTVTANIPMSTYKFTGLGVGSAATDSANLSQVQSTVTKLLNSVSGADTITATASPTLAAYAAGQMFYFVAAGDNTTSVTLNIDSLGAKAVTRDGSVALAAADIKSGEVIVVVYDGTRFQVVSQLNSAGDARFANVSIASSLYVGGVSTFVGNAGFSANVSIASALSVGGVAAITGATTIGGNLTLSGGTANGVLYLNGSKVATSGSAIQFDGTNLLIGTTSGTNKLTVNGNAVLLANGEMKFADSTNSRVSVIKNSGGASTSQIDFLTGDPVTTRMTLDTSGNLGIGTASPATLLDLGTSTGQKLSLYRNGTIRYGFAIETDTLRYYVPTGASNAVHSFGAISTTDGTTYTERLRLDSSGNLGLGVTPSAWSGNYKTIQNFGAGMTSQAGSENYLTANAYFDGSWKRIYASFASRYEQVNSVHAWYIAGSSTAGSTISFTQAMTLDASGNLLVGTTTPALASTVRAVFNDPQAGGIELVANNSGGVAIVPTSGGGVEFVTFSGAIGSESYTERARITSGGDFVVGKTAASIGTAGGYVTALGEAVFTVAANPVLYVNRLTDDGDLVRFYQADTQEGSISVSGNTVSYNAFAGSHWSQLQDGSKPDILRGTVMESINELCVWPDEQNERLPKSKVSDTAGSKKVYGVFMAWDNDWATTNDMYITAVGAFICRVNGSVTVQEGDLLESNGDGTARVQADDIIRSSTIGKVTSTVKTHQYADGSYCVPTVLYCG